MADRLDFRVSVTPIIEHAAANEGLGASVLTQDIKGSLGGGNSSATWAGSDIADWANGVHTHKSSGGGTITTGASCDGLFIKHTGYNNADTTVANTANVTVTIGSVVIATLAAGEAIFLPSPANTTVTLGDDGTAAAVQYALFT